MKKLVVLGLLLSVSLTACGTPKDTVKDVTVQEETYVPTTLVEDTEEKETNEQSSELLVSNDIEDFMAEYVETSTYLDSNPTLFEVDVWLDGTPNEVTEMLSPTSQTAKAIACIHLMDYAEGQNTAAGRITWQDLSDLTKQFGFADMNEFWAAWDTTTNLDYGTIIDTSSYQGNWSPNTKDYFFSTPGDVELLGDTLKLARDADGNTMMSDGIPICTNYGNYWVIIPGLEGAIASRPIFIGADVKVGANWTATCKAADTVKFGDDIPYIIINQKYCETLTAEQFSEIEQFYTSNLSFDYSKYKVDRSDLQTLEDVAPKYCQ